MEQEALYPFGFGLTYGNVKVSAAEFAEQPEKEKSVKIRCTVTNTENGIQKRSFRFTSKTGSQNMQSKSQPVRIPAREGEGGERVSRQNLPSIRGHLPLWTKRKTLCR